MSPRRVAQIRSSPFLPLPAPAGPEGDPELPCRYFRSGVTHLTQERHGVHQSRSRDRRLASLSRRSLVASLPRNDELGGGGCPFIKTRIYTGQSQPLATPIAPECPRELTHATCAEHAYCSPDMDLWLRATASGEPMCIEGAGSWDAHVPNRGETLRRKSDALLAHFKWTTSTSR